MDFLHGKVIRIVYGTAHFGKSLFWDASALLFAFYLTEIVGFSAQQMGWILGVTLVLNAGFDLFIGFAMNSFVTNARAASIAHLAGILIASAAFVSFCGIGLIPEDFRYAGALIALIIFRLGYAIGDVPQNAFMSFISFNDSDRARIAATRYVAAGIALLVLTLSFSPIIRLDDVDQQADLFFFAAVIIAIIAISCSTLLALFSRDRHVFGEHVPGPESHQNANCNGANQYFFPVLLASVAVLSLVAPAFNNLEAYFTAYALPAGAAAAYFMTSVAVGKVISQFLWARLGASIGLLNTLQFAAFTMVMACIVFGTTARQGGVFALGSGAFFGAAYGGLLMSLWGLCAKATALTPESTARRFGMFTFFSKMGRSASMIMLGYLLGLFDYTEAEMGAFYMSLIMSLIPLTGAVIIFAVSFKLSGSEQTER